MMEVLADELENTLCAGQHPEPGRHPHQDAGQRLPGEDPQTLTPRPI